VRQPQEEQPEVDAAEKTLILVSNVVEELHVLKKYVPETSEIRNQDPRTVLLDMPQEVIAERELELRVRKAGTSTWMAEAVETQAVLVEATGGGVTLV
jgi:hypothetical protein